MNSAGKEVLMDMAEQRHFLPVYRLNSVFQDQHGLDRKKTVGQNFKMILTRVDTSMPGARAWGLAGTTRPVMVVVDR